MYKYSKRNNPNKGIYYTEPAFISSEISLCGNIASAKFLPGEISRVRIFAMAKFCRCEFSLCRNFASVDAKFHQDNSEISFDSTKIRESLDENS